MQNMFIECRKNPAELNSVAQDFKQEIQRLEENLVKNNKK